jgi:hypothetical protein
MIGMFIPDPDLDFLPIPDPGSRGQKGTGSRVLIRITGFLRNRWAGQEGGGDCMRNRDGRIVRTPGPWTASWWASYPGAGLSSQSWSLPLGKPGGIPLNPSEESKITLFSVLRIQDVYPGFFPSRTVKWGNIVTFFIFHLFNFFRPV